jgi:hypothetical protein
MIDLFSIEVTIESRFYYYCLFAHIMFFFEHIHTYVYQPSASFYSTSLLVLKNGVSGRQLLVDWWNSFDVSQSRKKDYEGVVKIEKKHAIIELKDSPMSVNGFELRLLIFIFYFLFLFLSLNVTFLCLLSRDVVFKYNTQTYILFLKGWFSMEVNSSQSSASLVAIAVDVWSKESSSCTSSNSVTRLSTDRFSLVVSVNENTLNILRYSLCSWMSEMDPLDVILISDLPRHRLGGSAEVYLRISFTFSLSLSLTLTSLIRVLLL